MSTVNLRSRRLRTAAVTVVVACTVILFVSRSVVRVGEEIGSTFVPLSTGVCSQDLVRKRLVISSVAFPVMHERSREIAGPSTRIQGVVGSCVVGADGTIFAVSAAEDAILIFAASAAGDVAPARTISGPKTRLAEPISLALQHDGTLVVGNFLTKTITKYSPAARGDVAPLTTIGGPATYLECPTFIAIEQSDTLLVKQDSQVVCGDAPMMSRLVFGRDARGNSRPVVAFEVDPIWTPFPRFPGMVRENCRDLVRTRFFPNERYCLPLTRPESSTL